MTAPYFIYPVIKELETCTDAPRREKLKMLIAANVSSPEALAKRIEGLDFRSMFADDDTPHSAQDDTIDAFLQKFGMGDSSGELLPSEPAYSFESPPSEPDSFEAAMQNVKNLVKSGHYHEALENINAIYLNNSEKSIYFADQIRFIRKLMLNEQKKKQK